MANVEQLIKQTPLTVEKIYEYHEKQELLRSGPHRGRLGASQIGRPCDRGLWYAFRLCTKPIFSGRILRLFQTGHLEEPRIIEELRGIGCTVHDVDDTSKEQFEFIALGGHFVCHPDSIILGVPEAPKTWHLGEYKTMGGTETQSKDFEKVVKEGVEKAKPEHFAQVQVGMGLAGLTRALYICKKKATDELHSERVKFDKKAFTRLMERAERIITSNDVPERCTKRADDFRCRFCDHKGLCWGTGDVAVPLSFKMCRTCCHSTPQIDEDETWGRWTCSKNGKDIDSTKVCEDHLLLPGLVVFAAPTDSGDDWIEFTNTDGLVWVHGNKNGQWGTDELMTVPASMIDSNVTDVKEAFEGKMAKFNQIDENLVNRYPPTDSRLDVEFRAYGDTDNNTGFFDWAAGQYGEATGVFKDENHEAIEYAGKFLAVVYLDNDYAAVWEGNTERKQECPF